MSDYAVMAFGVALVAAVSGAFGYSVASPSEFDVRSAQLIEAARLCDRYKRFSVVNGGFHFDVKCEKPEITARTWE